MTLKLATVFSGIGAIEHALERMKIDYEIVFACDNGDIDILSKKIPNNIIAVEQEISDLNTLVNEIKDEKYDENYFQILKKKLNSIEENYSVFLDDLKETNDIYFFSNNLLKNIMEMEYYNKSTKKIYEDWMDVLDNVTNEEAFSNEIRLLSIQVIIKIVNDYKRFTGNNLIKEFKHLDEDTRLNFDRYADISKLKVLNQTIKNIAENLSMLHEQINSIYILNKLNKIDSFSEKKQYVDDLYNASNKINQVKKSYFSNYKIDETNFHWNASFLDGKQYKGDVDLLVGGSPCQSFSLVGKQRGLEDTRGTLFYEYARLIEEIQPKVFIYENVKAILSNDDGRTWETMCKVFDDLGYQWSHSVLNAKDYGIPQNRERVFVVGFRNDVEHKKFEFPKPVLLKTTMKDYLLDNVSGKYYLPEKGVKFVTAEKNLEKRYTQIDGEIQLCQKRNQQFNWHGDFVFVEENNEREKTIEDLDKYFLSEKVTQYVMSTGTKGFYSKPKIDLDVARPLLTTMHKMHRAGVDNYVTTDGRIRKLTPRECLRLMGFCDSFKIAVSDTAMYQQAGNSIVVDVLIAIMDRIIYSLGSEFVNE